MYDSIKCVTIHVDGQQCTQMKYRTKFETNVQCKCSFHYFDMKLQLACKSC